MTAILGWIFLYLVVNISQWHLILCVYRIDCWFLCSGGHTFLRITRYPSVVHISALHLIHTHPLTLNQDFSRSQSIHPLVPSCIVIYNSSPADVDLLRWAYKKGREMARRMASYRGEYEPGHPRFPKGSQAATNASASPVDISFPDIVYSAEDNEAIDTYCRETGLYPHLPSLIYILTAFSRKYMAFCRLIQDFNSLRLMLITL